MINDSITYDRTDNLSGASWLGVRHGMCVV